MNTKIMTSAGCLLLLAAAMAPGVLGHDDGRDDPVTAGIDVFGAGVSGRYVGAAGPAYAPDAYNLPQNTIASGSMLCDAEVTVDDQTYPLNEELIDLNGAAQGNAGWLPDTFDDGGTGGACHTRTYTTHIFNTPGCRGGHSARGVNSQGGDIFLAASCDWKRDFGGPGPEESLALCLVNGVRVFNSLGNLNTEGGVLAQCVLDFVICVTAITGCGGTGDVEACGGDNIPDAINFGYGSGLFPGAIATFPGPLLTAQTAVGPPPAIIFCPQAFMTEGIFVFDTVASTTGAYVDPGGLAPIWVPTGLPEVYPALSGQVWTVYGGCWFEYENVLRCR